MTSEYSEPRPDMRFKFTIEDMEAAWEMGWANARGTYTALYTKADIPAGVTLRNPFGMGTKEIVVSGIERTEGAAHGNH